MWGSKQMINHKWILEYLWIDKVISIQRSITFYYEMEIYGKGSVNVP